MLDALTDQRFRLARRDGCHESPEAYAFDALMAMADHATGRCDCHLQRGAGTEQAQASNNDNGGDGADHPAESTDVTGDGSAAGADVTGEEDAEPGNDAGRGVTANHPAEATARIGEVDAEPTMGTAGDPGIFAAPAPSAPSSVCGVRPARSVNPRYQALLRVDVAALRRGHVAGDELCETLPCQAAG